MKDNTKKTQALEALLFIYGEPMAHKKIEKILGITAKEREALVGELETALEERGLGLLSHGGALQLTTKPEHAKILEAVVKEELSGELTPAALETLAIISYLGPVGRARVDYIRGVNSSYIIRNLLLRGLLTRTQKGNAYEYDISAELVRHFGLGKKAELPEFEKYRNLIVKSERTLEKIEGGSENHA